jgi:hypothetical protein
MRFSLPVLMFAAHLIVATAQAEVPLLTPDELRQQSSHIATGKVRNVYTTEKVLDEDYVDTLFAVEVVVTTAEKGPDIVPGQVIFAKAWRMKQRKPDWAGPSGQDAVPKKGQVVKLYLTGGNGNFDALSPNGISILKQHVDK